MFRAVTPPGAPATGFGNLNWVEFSGPGVGIAPDFIPEVPGTVGGTVPATLSLTLGTPASFGAFTPGVARDYTASTAANVISTAGDATLSVADPSSTNTGHLVNGSFSLPQKLQANAGTAFAPVGGSAAPTHAEDLVRSDLERVGDDQLQAVDRGQRRAPYRRVQQDPDVHAVTTNP